MTEADKQLIINLATGMGIEIDGDTVNFSIDAKHVACQGITNYTLTTDEVEQIRQLHFKYGHICTRTLSFYVNILDNVVDPL